MLRHDILKLRIVKVCIEPILRKQLFMVALLDDISVLHDKNQIRITNRGQPVGDEDRKSTRLNSSHMPKSRMPSSA